MNSPAFGLRVASVLFALVCLAHVGRVVGRIDVQIGAFTVSQGMSLVAALLTAVLSTWLWQLSRNAKEPQTLFPVDRKG